MTRPQRVLALLVVGAAVGVAAACTPPDGPGPRDDVDGIEGDDGDASDLRDGELPEATLDLEVGPLSSGGDDFQPYQDPPQIELVRGFQGGYHIEPTLRLSGVEASTFTADVRYVVRRTSNGRRVNRRSEFEISPRGWNETPGGWVHYSNPVIFAIRSASDIVGDEVELQVFVDVQSGGFGRATVVGEVVDDQNNSPGPGPGPGPDGG